MWAWPEHCLPCQSFLDIPVQLDLLEAEAVVVSGCPQEESFCDLIFSTAEGSVVQKSSRLSHPAPNLVRYHVLNTHIHNTLSDAHTHTYTFSYTRSPCSPKLSEPTARAETKHPQRCRRWGPSLHSRLHSAKSAEGGSHSAANSPSECDPADMTPLF